MILVVPFLTYAQPDDSDELALSTVHQLAVNEVRNNCAHRRGSLATVNEVGNSRANLRGSLATVGGEPVKMKLVSSAEYCVWPSLLASLHRRPPSGCKPPSTPLRASQSKTLHSCCSSRRPGPCPHPLCGTH